MRSPSTPAFGMWHSLQGRPDMVDRQNLKLEYLQKKWIDANKIGRITFKYVQALYPTEQS